MTALPAAAWTVSGTKSCTALQTSWALGDGTQWVSVWGLGSGAATSIYSSARHTVTDQGISGGGYWKVEISGTAYRGYAYCSNAS